MRNNYFKSVILIMIMFFGYSAMGQTERQKEQITSRYDKQKINQLQSEFQNKANQEKQRVDALAQIRNLQKRFESDGKLLELKKFTPEGQPIYFTTFNVDAARSTRTDHLNSGGSLGLNLNGQNMTAHVWDGGLARASHQEYDGAGGSNRFSIGDGTSALHYHSAHVTGTIMASGVVANAKGMAPHADAIGYDWNSDLAEATTAAGNGMLISNHSYGYATRNPNTGQPWLPDHYFGGYIDDSRDWDDLMFNAPNYLMVVAAGNDGNDNTANGAPLDGNSSYDKLTGHSTSKNNLVVANAQDANIDGSGNLISVTISGSSSEGPTDDYRIKPDITGNGSGVYSTYESSNTAYNSISGTSMASPNVAGTLLILQQHANNVNGSFMRAATLKGLALHTADDAGPNGPDAVYGWGLMNAKRAAEAITNNGNESKIEELTLSSGQTYQITVDSDGVNDLMASISWTDRAGTANTITNNNTPVLVNDLDVRVTKGGTTHNPWRLTGITTNGTGDNNVDPYERVDVANASGTYTITVTHKGSLTGGSQNYSLIITGLSSTPVVCNATTPVNLNVDGFGSSTATISWDAVPGASYDVRYRETGGSWATTNVGGSSTSLSGLTPETTYEVQVRSVCPDSSTSSYSGSVNFTTTEVQLNYCDSASTNISDEYIGRVQLNTIDNVSGGQFYTDFTNISTDLTKDTQYTVTVTPTWTGTIYSEGYSVWIDYNKDGDFQDVGEQVWTQSATQATPVSGNFTVPNGAVTGSTRMRVSMSYNAIPSDCGSFTYGEVEDYTVNIDSGTPDETAPVITLVGSASVNIDQGDNYNDQGATASDNVDGDITANIVAVNPVNTSVVGTYVVTYNVSDAAGNAATEVTRTVNVNAVVDTTPPIITRIGPASVDVNQGDAYNDQGATATDNIDGDITASIVTVNQVDTNVIGTYTVTYNVSDAAGNAATEVTRTVNVNEVVDTTAPIITLVGSSPVNITVGDAYNDQGATATDDVDGDITANIVTVNPVNSNVVGTYVVTYNVSDNAGNVATEVTRTVNVNDIVSDVILNQGFFESGWDGWTDGGSDCARRADATRSYEGTYSIRIRDNSGAASAMTLSNIDLTPFAEVEVDFYFYVRSMENNEDFWLRYYNGSSWSTVATWTRGVDINNNTFYNATVVLTASQFSFASNSGFRFQNDASGNNDQIFIDQVTITGKTNSSSSQNSVTALGGGYTITSDEGANGLEDEFSIYPNPVSGNILNVKLLDDSAVTYRIMNMIGQTVISGELKDQQVNVETLKSGMYFIEINDGEETMTKKFIRR